MIATYDDLNGQTSQTGWPVAFWRTVSASEGTQTTGVAWAWGDPWPGWDDPADNNDPPKTFVKIQRRRQVLPSLPRLLPLKRKKPPVPLPVRRDAKPASLVEHRQWMQPAVASSMRTRWRRPRRLAYWKR